VLLNEEIEHSP